MGFWALESWVAGVASLTMIEGEGEGSIVIAAVGVGVTRKKDTGGHQ